MNKRISYRKWRRPYKRVLTDSQVFDAMKLRGYKPPFDFMAIVDTLPKAFGYRLITYTRMKSTLGTEFGRWELG